MSVRCPCCRGTGTLELGAGMSEAALLRRDLARAWDVVGRLEEFVISNMEASSEAITGLVGELDGTRSRIDAQNEQISSLETRLAIHNIWNSRTSDEQPTETRRQFRRRTGAGGGAPRKAGGQPGHKGRARRDKPEGTIHMTVEMCGFCGTVP